MWKMAMFRQRKSFERNFVTTAVSRQQSLEKTTVVSSYVNNATSSLICRRFSECLSLCEAGIAAVIDELEIQRSAVGRAVIETLTEWIFHPKDSKTLETLCIIAIQAYAELGQWQNVISFLQNVYEDIANCPPKVIQMCILMLSNVNEFMQCQAVCNIWCRNCENQINPGYFQTVKLYITEILLPNQETGLIIQFINGCQGLNTAEKEELKFMCSRSVSEVEQVRWKAKGDTGAKTEISANQIALNVGKWAANKIKYISFSFAVKLTMMAAFLYMATISTQKSDPLSGTAWAANLLDGVKKFWLSLFGPYRRKKAP